MDIYGEGGIDVIDGDIFAIFNDLEKQLHGLFNTLRAMQAKNFADQVYKLAERVVGISQASADIVLGAVHIGEDSTYSVRHQVNAAVITSILTEALNLTFEEQRTAAAAALTQNVGMIYLQELLEKQPSELSAYQWEKVRTHTLRGVQILRASGVANDDWLAAILHHHERVDGRGYPQRLKSADISLFGRVLAVADVYCPLIKKRAYRGNISAIAALREMMVTEGGELDRNLVQLLVKTIGIYPPGSLVQLKTKEIAIVVQRGSDAHQPVVYTLADGRGKPIEVSEMLDCSDEDVVITRMISNSSSFAESLPLRDIWNDIFMLNVDGF